MEKKTLLAIVLSVVVLFAYETIFVVPKRAQMVKEAQSKIAEPKKAEITPPAVPAKVVQKTTNQNFKEETWVLKTTKITAEVSNMGGSLHNVTLIGQKSLPLTGILATKGSEKAQYKLVSKDAKKVVVAYSNGDYQIVKTYSIIDNNALSARMDIVPLKEGDLMSRLENISILTIDATGVEPSQHDAMLHEYSIFTDNKIIRKGSAFKFNAKENKVGLTPVKWAGLRNHYSAFLVRPEFETKQYEIQTLSEKSLNISIVPSPSAKGNSYEFTIFAGPQDTSLMKKYNKEFEKSVAFFNWSFMNIFAMGIYYLIPFIHGIFKSWGMSIILVSILIYALTYPLTVKSMLSMRRMQQMQPKIKALQDRFKNDPQKLNAEIMDIYRREKINPLGGCLPLLLQMPIFIALYQVLWRSYYFQGEGFLWIKDLTQPDRLFLLPFSLPFLGNEFNILPILMALVMFFQQKMSSKSMVVTDEQQAMQQKMMMYFFPVFIGFIFYKFASGLSLYFTVFYLLSALTQWKMNQVKQ